MTLSYRSLVQATTRKSKTARLRQKICFRNQYSFKPEFIRDNIKVIYLIIAVAAVISLLTSRYLTGLDRRGGGFGGVSTIVVRVSSWPQGPESVRSNFESIYPVKYRK